MCHEQSGGSGNGSYCVGVHMYVHTGLHVWTCAHMHLCVCMCVCAHQKQQVPAAQNTVMLPTAGGHPTYLLGRGTGCICHLAVCGWASTLTAFCFCCFHCKCLKIFLYTFALPSEIINWGTSMAALPIFFLSLPTLADHATAVSFWFLK